MSPFVDPLRLGMAAEYADERALLRAAAALRGRGYRRLDAFVPTEVEGLDEALAMPRSRIPRVTFAAGVLGAASGYLVQWYCNAVSYPIDVGGRPIHSALAFIPITFEMMVLFASVATTVALFAACRLPELWAPINEVPGFERATIDRYWLAVDRRDAAFEARRTREHFFATQPIRIVDLAEAPA